MSRKRNQFVFFLLSFVVLISFTGCKKISNAYDSATGAPTDTKKFDSSSEERPMAGDVLLKVGSWTITLDEFNIRIEALKEVVPNFDPSSIETKKLILEELMNQQLLVIDAEKSGVLKEKEVKDAIEEFRRQLLVRQSAAKLTEGISVSADEARGYYDDNPNEFLRPEEWKVRELVVDDELKASELLVDILKGADFVQVIKENSIGKSAENEGDLGFITQVPFPEMAQALLSLEEGKETTGVFKGPEGYYVVKVEDKIGGDPIPYEEIEEPLVQNLTLKKQQEIVLKYIEELKTKIKVEKNESLLK